jgi:hypothetical protein
MFCREKISLSLFSSQESGRDLNIRRVQIEMAIYPYLIGNRKKYPQQVG